MPQYQYKFATMAENRPINLMEDELNELGEEGWRVVSILPRTGHLVFLLTKTGKRATLPISETVIQQFELELNKAPKQKLLWSLLHGSTGSTVNHEILCDKLYPQYGGTKYKDLTSRVREKLRQKLRSNIYALSLNLTKHRIPYRIVNNESFGYYLEEK